MITNEVLALKARHAQTWADKPQWFWMVMLMEEIVELLGALLGLHKGPVEWELKQIAAIAMNWLEHRADQGLGLR